MSAYALVAILLLAPFVGFLLNGLRFRSPKGGLAGTIATLASGISFAAAVALYLKILCQPEDLRTLRVIFFNWISVDEFSVNAGFVIDQMSSIMALVITGVGTLIHLFSVGYMSHDERPTKYFAYLNLFLFNMLLLVLGENLVLMFVGWEGVGLCSYLLIGFWFKDVAKANAGLKAFLTNRIGDAAFLLGIFLLFATFNTVTFAELNAAISGTAEIGWTGPVTLACLFLFIGATGKSAQIPLYVWLPDAMAGPTPVSALIHAATMVTAGIYMIVRLNPVFMMAPNALMVVAYVGAVTAVVAASIGLTQWDIKKVLAYSTVSQLGYMFLGVGVGAFSAGMFHLVTHAFFKALMFLGAGSVIHALHDEQDIRKMGGLKKAMPVTYVTFMLGWLAIIGIPPFAGFFSKDEILWRAFSSPHGSPLLWVLGVLGSAMTAFYMTRLMALVFWGKSRNSNHAHEAPITMTIPLVVLGFLSVVGGWAGIPHVMGNLLGHVPNLFEVWLEPLMTKTTHVEAKAVLEWSLMGLSVAVAGLSAWTAYYFYLVNPELPAKVAAGASALYRVVVNKYFVDELYERFIVNPLVSIAKDLWLYVDVKFIDKSTYILSDTIRGAGRAIKAMQNGNMQQYALYISLGMLATVTYILKIVLW